MNRRWMRDIFFIALIMLSSMAAAGESPAERRPSSDSSGLHGNFSAKENEEKIIDEDHLAFVPDTTLFPWSTIVRLRGHFDHKTNTCTGVMIASNVVLTAAHCVYDRDDDEWAISFEASPGKVGLEEPFGTVNSVDHIIDMDYVIVEDFDKKKHDWALLALDEPIGDTVGWLPVGTATHYELFNYMLHIASYPSGDCDSCGYTGKNMFYDSDVAVYIADLYFDHVTDTLSGSSGAGVWIEKSCGRPLVVAVHRSGYTSGESNSATRLTEVEIAAIIAFVQEHGGVMTCPGYIGGDPCCMLGDPCGLGESGGCDCQGFCDWDGGDCASCEADCGAGKCGMDSCGGFCGMCSGHPYSCCDGGVCSCQPQECWMLNLECGAGDDGCGATLDCGSCEEHPNSQCEEGACVCQPDCGPEDSPRECGGDDCGGSCGVCDDGLSCTVDACDETTGACLKEINPYFCLIDDVCLPSGAEDPAAPCGKCRPGVDSTKWSPAPDGVICPGGICAQGSCCPKVTNCEGRLCGADGCGGVCGTCGATESCDDQGHCQPVIADPSPGIIEQEACDCPDSGCCLTTTSHGQTSLLMMLLLMLMMGMIRTRRGSR